MKRLAVLASGNGSNLQAILDDEELGGQVVLVGSNKCEAYALERARRQGVEAFVLNASDYPSREAYDRALADRVSQSRPDWVVLAGWMRILTAEFLDRFPQQVLNLHPALPGQYPGLNAIERAFRDGRSETGCMVHYTVPEVDAGPLLDTETVAILPGDSLEQVTERMHQAEHRLLVRVLRNLTS